MIGKTISHYKTAHPGPAGLRLPGHLEEGGAEVDPDRVVSARAPGAAVTSVAAAQVENAGPGGDLQEGFER